MFKFCRKAGIVLILACASYGCFILGNLALRSYRQYMVNLESTTDFASVKEPNRWEVFFIPGDEATGKVVDLVNRADYSVFVQANTFTSEPLARALIKAHQRKVSVKVVMDPVNVYRTDSQIKALHSASIAIRLEGTKKLAHSKIVIIDDEVVAIGNFNFSDAAHGRNSENLMVIHSQDTAHRYWENWENHWREAVPYADYKPGK